MTPDCLLDSSLGSHEYMTANGIKFHYVVKGNRTKPLMLMLHGFPEVRVWKGGGDWGGGGGGGGRRWEVLGSGRN